MTQEMEVGGGYVEIGFTLDRPEARNIARRYLDRYPKEGYDTHISNWYWTKNNKIHFKIRRLKNCD